MQYFVSTTESSSSISTAAEKIDGDAAASTPMMNTCFLTTPVTITKCNLQHLSTEFLDQQSLCCFCYLHILCTESGNRKWKWLTTISIRKKVRRHFLNLKLIVLIWHITLASHELLGLLQKVQLLHKKAAHRCILLSVIRILIFTYESHQNSATYRLVNVCISFLLGPSFTF